MRSRVSCFVVAASIMAGVPSVVVAAPSVLLTNQVGPVAGPVVSNPQILTSYDSSVLGISPAVDSRADYESGPLSYFGTALASLSAHSLAAIALPSGTFSLLAVGQEVRVGSQFLGTQAGAAAFLGTIIDFDVAGAGATTVTTVTLNVESRGTLAWGQGAAGLATQGLAIGINTDVTTAGTRGLGGISLNNTCRSLGCSFSKGLDSFDRSLGFIPTLTQRTSPVGADLISIQIPLVGAHPQLTLQFSTNLGTNGGNVDFSDGISIGLDTPSGVTFISDSGLLSAVPEPAAHLSLAAGLACLLAMVRRTSTSA